MMNIKSYRDLRVWQVGMDIAEGCCFLTRPFPREEQFGMTSQIRRAASSIPANIAEGYGKQNRNEYLQFLRIAKGSLKELETHLASPRPRRPDLGRRHRSFSHPLQRGRRNDVYLYGKVRSKLRPGGYGTLYR